MIQLQFGMPLFLMGFYGGVMVLAVLNAIRCLKVSGSGARSIA